MKTKLVYVLTCAPDKHYIEQAHISLYSARYHNPDAHIVLIVDQMTDTLFVGKRAELLKYVSEKIVVDVPACFNVMQASRWIKTSVRNLIVGDFLFIDCDTIVTQSLIEVDYMDVEIGAVLDCHRPVSIFRAEEREELLLKAKKCGWNFNDVEKYYSSGVLYVKDSNLTRNFYNEWHKNYLYTANLGVNIDQISLEKTKQELQIISDIDDVWNTIMFTRPSFVYDAKILHCASLDNNVFLFSKRVLAYIYQHGLTEYIKDSIINPSTTFLPYKKVDYKGLRLYKNICRITSAVRKYAKNIDMSLSDLKIQSRFANIIYSCYKNRLYFIGTFLWIGYIRITGKYNPLEKYFN